MARNRLTPEHRTSAKPLRVFVPRRKRRVDGEIPAKAAQQSLTIVATDF